MKTGQTLQSHQTPIATDADTAAAFKYGITSLVQMSRDAYPADIPDNNIGNGSMPHKRVWGNGFCKP